MQTSPTASFLIGLWLGGSVFLVGVVSWNFAAVGPAMEANPALAERAGFDPADDEAKRASPIWVYASELNRGVFTGWNRVQLVLGAVTLLVVALRWPRGAATALVATALLLVLFMTFWLEPRVIEIGRSLDFVPREPRPPALDEFDSLHSTYTVTALIKLLLLLVALPFTARKVVSEGAEPVAITR